MAKVRNISVETEYREEGFRPGVLEKYPWRAEVHRDDGTWSYGYAGSKEGAVKAANQRLDDDDPRFDSGE